MWRERETGLVYCWIPVTYALMVGMAVIFS
jgi:hypothetical protein